MDAAFLLVKLEAVFRDKKDPVGLRGPNVLSRRRVERVWGAEKREVCAGDISCLPGLG